MKPKRKLTEINFEKEGSHVALVGKHQGGPANGVTTLILKATDDISEEATKKAMSSLNEGEQPKENNEAQMQEEIQKAVEAAEAVIKAKYQEELSAKEVELKKALDEIEQYKQEKKEDVAKSRKEKLESVLPKAEAEELFEAIGELPDVAFEAVLKSVKNKAKAEQESDAFKELGVSGEGNPIRQEEAGLALVGELIKSKKKTK